jgi:hypothetical protein
MRKPDTAVPRVAPRAGAIALSALALSLAACSSSGSPAAVGTSASSSASGVLSGPMLGATFTGTLYVSTPTSHLTKAFTDRVANVQNCQVAAQDGWDGTFKVPSPEAPDPQAVIEVAGFHGPGTYTPTMLRRDRADMILMPGKAGTSQYDITTVLAKRTPGKEVLFLQKNGSGELVYSGAHLNGQPGGTTVAGLIQWNCKS